MPSVPFVIPGDCVVQGNLSAASMTPSAGSVTNASVATPASGGGIAPAKILQKIIKTVADKSSVDASTYTEPIHIAEGPGSVVGFKAGSVVVAGAATNVTVDLKKNGSTVLSGTITLDNTRVARTMYSAGIASAAYVAGDFFEVVFTLTGTNEPTGTTAQLITNEDG